MAVSAALQLIPLISIHALLAESDADTLTDDVSTGGFLSTLSLRRATTWPRVGWIAQKFLSTLSLRRATLAVVIGAVMTTDFYPRSPCGERLLVRPVWSIGIAISIHALLAESDISAPLWTVNPILISIHALLAESDLQHRKEVTLSSISIHALLAESDYTCQVCGRKANISIHALLAESDPTGQEVTKMKLEFLSTLSLRRATFFRYDACKSNRDFYPRSPCGERRFGQCSCRQR